MEARQEVSNSVATVGGNEESPGSEGGDPIGEYTGLSRHGHRVKGNRMVVHYVGGDAQCSTVCKLLQTSVGCSVGVVYPGGGC